MTTQELLTQILARMERMELKVEALSKSVSGPSAGVAKTSAEAVLREKLDRLTVKRHAVFTASLAGNSYQEIAKLMGCDVTTAKLHLKAALAVLGISSRSVLLMSNKGILDPIPDIEYEKRYGISKRWWLEQKPETMEVLRMVKRASNQYTKEEA
jgi:FixJ family two-component response regulator